jgi:hypothetical protein
MIEEGCQVPVFRNISALEVAKGVKAFLSLEVGLTRGRLPKLGDSEQLQVQTQKLEQAQRQLEQNQQRLEKKDRRITQLEKQSETTKSGDTNPENIIWILGTARSGSSWLARMMLDLESHVVWNEPRVGELFGEYMYWHELRTAREAHILSSHHRNTWLNSIRTFVLDGAKARSRKMGEEAYLVIKEPNGSIGAPLLLEALPESRMIFLIRDPRDVCSSVLVGARRGNWLYTEPEEGGWTRNAEGAPLSPADENPDAFVEERANRYLRDIGNSKQAYEAHAGRKVMVKYEDLRVDTLGTMKRIYSALEMVADEDELARVVDEQAWENISEDNKGEDKPLRKATPGGWKEDLTPKQVQIVERITAPLLKELYES